MDVVFLAPAYPSEMPEFVAGLAKVGARVFGVGDSPVELLPEKTKQALFAYLQVPRILDDDDVIRRVLEWLAGRQVQRVESLWEPLVECAARLREHLGVPGMSPDVVRGFRDKQLMKERIAAAGLRVPKSERVRTVTEARAAALAIGFPLIIKPIAGAGSADTYRVDDADQLERVLGAMHHVVEASVEEFVEGEEFTYDTVCIDGTPVYENVAQYLPRPLVARSHEHPSPVICTVRDLATPKFQDGLAFGRGVLEALGMGTGFTHMEWYRTAAGEVVFGEIGCRPGGARLVDQMNYTSDTDLFVEWARAVCWGCVEGSFRREHNTAIIFKRAHGQGRIHRIEGLEAFLARNHRWVCGVDLLPVGSYRRDWTQTLISDGWILVRHPDWDEALRIAGEAANDVHLFAG